MAAGPVTSTPASSDDEPTGSPDELAALRRERAALERRALEAEALAEQLADELAEARRRLAAQAEAADAAPVDPTHLSVMDGAEPAEPGSHFAPDGSDRAVLPLALAGIAVVAFLVAVVTVVAGRFSFLTVVALAVAGALVWAAAQTRVAPVTVEVVDGVVEVTSGESRHTFDLRNEQVKVDVQGRPGDEFWRVRFYRRALDPVDIDATMVDAADFMRRLREYRPGL